MRFLLFSLLMLEAFAVQALPAPDKKLVLGTSDGAVEYPVKEIRRITFADGMMSVDMRNGSAFTLGTDSVNSVSFSDYIPSGETDVEPVPASPLFTVQQGKIDLNSASLVAVQVYACDGVVIYDTVCRGALSLDMRPFAQGIYILEIDGKIYKITNR